MKYFSIKELFISLKLRIFLSQIFKFLSFKSSLLLVSNNFLVEFFVILVNPMSKFLSEISNFIFIFPILIKLLCLISTIPLNEVSKSSCVGIKFIGILHSPNMIGGKRLLVVFKENSFLIENTIES
jgi:hypothetical protein